MEMSYGGTMLKKIKKAFTILVFIYILLCVIIHFSYNNILRIIGNNEIVYSSFEGEKYIVFLEEETVNFARIQNVNIDLLGLSKIPIVEDRIIYTLEDPEQSKRMSKFDGKKYFLYDENNLLSNGMVIEGYQLRNFHGEIESTYVYFGVSKEKPEIKEGLIDIKKYYSDALNENYYLFMYEREDEIKFDELCNFSF